MVAVGRLDDQSPTPITYQAALHLAAVRFWARR